MHPSLDFVSFAISVIGPVIVLIGFGYLLFKINAIDDPFVEQASRLVFNFALPALLFTTISSSSLTQLTNLNVIMIGVLGTLAIFIGLLVITPFFVKQKIDRGVVIQGAFRSNMGIIGLAYCANAYGNEGLAYGAIYLGCLTIVYNLLSVVVLNIYQQQHTSYAKIAKEIATNPIILAILLGLAVSYFDIDTPAIVINSAGYFAQLTLPLALLCTGAALRFSSMHKHVKSSAFSIIVKCGVYPALLVLLAISLDITGMPLMIIFLMATCPTAAASYVMVRKIGGNHQLAAQIVALSTVVSVPFTLLGFSIIKLFALV